MGATPPTHRSRYRPPYAEGQSRQDEAARADEEQPQTDGVEVRTDHREFPLGPVLWHSTIDLLTVRYFEMTGQADDVIRRDNSKDYQGKYHSGLSADELADEQLVLRAYENRLGQATNSVLTRRIERLGTKPGAAKS